VLLRDDALVRPTEFENEHLVPPRLSGVLEPRISIWNIDGQIVTQTLLVWEQAAPQRNVTEAITYSVIIVSTRYTRRLQAVLLGLVNQKDFDLGQVEVLVAYVPGIDATDDLIDSLERAHPELRLIRSPFHERHVRAKGFMINETTHLASGEWLILLDSDIVAPAHLLQEIDKVTEESHFIAPVGRKMLSPETTAKVLLGEIRPWECYEELLGSAGESRLLEADGTPIGFCQCIRKDIYQQVGYIELDHFEGSDWVFGDQVVKRFGRATRINVQVLHLDHGGSQWYGAAKHM